ncbi:hypothetical protein WGT02_30900 (plasmid) [Rhizobium sp. T1470]|uniref:hypothetical protein n=1 Tax=unclassified Rhizobium TaxID=2613769 RepID=UPI001AAFCA81|nr:hypothetical protein [Rhizobium sp. T1473]MCA0806011.1 hypothetical protein [Rhizobium sp. T1473]
MLFQSRMNVVSRMRGGDGFRVPPDAARTFEDAPRAASAKRSRALPLMPKFSEERRYLHMHSAARQILAAE